MGVAMDRSKSPYIQVLIIAAVAVTYLAAARLGLLLALPPGYATPFWPPSGIAVASVLFLGNWAWPGIFLGSFIANMLTSSGIIPANLLVSSGIALGSTLQAVVVAYLINRFANGTEYFRSHKTVFNFFVATFIGCLIACTIGLFSLYLGKIVTFQDFGLNWVTWWLGDSVGIFVFTTFIATAIKTFDADEFFHQSVEAFQIVTYITLIAVVCFWDWIGDSYPIEYMFIPFIIWAIFRFEPYFTFGLLIAISLIAIWGTASKYGPFERPSVNESLILLQAFIGVFSMGSLFMMAILNELETAYAKLEDYNKLLQEQIYTSDKMQTAPLAAEKAIANLKNHSFTSTSLKGNSNQTSIDFNGLVIGFTNLAYLNRQSSETNFKLNLSKQLDPSIGLVELAPVDFSRALILLLDNAFDSVINTEHKIGKSYTPIISVNTHDLGNKVSLTIRDNGITNDKTDNKTKLRECHDLIVGKLKGELRSQKKENYSEYQIIFSKTQT